MTRTLHLTNAYHEQSGGIRTTYHALLEYAEQHGRRMTLVVPGAADCDERRGRFTRIVHLRAPRSPVADGRYRMLLPHRFLPVGRGPLWRLLDEERPDVVEVCDKYSLCYFAGLIRRRPRQRRPVLVGLSCERMDDNLEAFLGLGAATRAVARSVMGRVYIGMFDVHLANSEYTANELRRAMRPPHLRPVHVCPPGVDVSDGIPGEDVATARRDLLARCGQPDATVLLYAGRLSPEKQVLLLPRIVAALARRTPPVHLVIAGDGPLRARLESDAASTVAGRIHVLGHMSRVALWTLLHACDVFIHPNPREPFGLGPLEAMAARTPVVAPASGGLRSYATEDNAWLSAADPIALASAVTACLDDPVERHRRAAEGRRTAEAHTSQAAAAQMFAHYDAVHLTAATGRIGSAASLLSRPSDAQIPRAPSRSSAGVPQA
jgi:alpha-1,6-mannosyltransferase